MCCLILVSVLASAAVAAEAQPVRLVCPAFVVEIDPRLGAWSLVDARSGVRWPTAGTSSAGKAKGLEGGFDKATSGARSVQLTGKNGNTVTFAIVDDDRSLQISYGGKDMGDIRLLGDCSVLTDREAAAVIVPCREGLLIPADSGVSFDHIFEGLVGVAGRDYHNLKPESLGAHVIPFWEMVYHDCQVCYGKYGYNASRSAEYVAHHLLAARPLSYHSIPDHLYWKAKDEGRRTSGDQGCYTRADQGWAEGLHPADGFLKTTQEVLGPLHLTTAHDRLTRFEFLGKGGLARCALPGGRRTATTL